MEHELDDEVLSGELEGASSAFDLFRTSTCLKRLKQTMKIIINNQWTLSTTKEVVSGPQSQSFA